MTITASEKQDMILLVDDEENILRSLKRELLDMPFDLVTASSACMALEVMHEHKVAVIISDQRMPGMSGTDLLAVVREQYPDTVRILLTAFSDMQDILDAINKSGIYKFIQKPWKTDELKKIIAEAVDYYRLCCVQNREKQRVQGRAETAHQCAVSDGRVVADR